MTMPPATKEALDVLIFLLPGLVGVRVSSWFVRVGRPQGIEIVVLALVFNLVVYALYGLLPAAMNQLFPSAVHVVTTYAPKAVAGLDPWPPVFLFSLGAFVGLCHGLLSSKNVLCKHWCHKDQPEYPDS